MNKTETDLICPSCGHDRPDRFCPACGEERVRPDDLRLHRFLTSAATEFSNLDGTVPATIKLLVTRPGRLTSEYLAGRRRPYVRPFQLYVLISLLFFLILPHTGIFGYKFALYHKPTALAGVSAPLIDQELARTRVSLAQYEARFNKRIAGHKQALMLLLIPLFALSLLLLTRGRPYALHAVFAIHFFALLLLYMVAWVGAMMLVALPLLRLLPRETWSHLPKMSGDELIALTVLLPATVYLAKAAREVYGGGRWLNAVRGVVMMLWLDVLIVAGYRTALFFTTYWSLRVY